MAPLLGVSGVDRPEKACEFSVTPGVFCMVWVSVKRDNLGRKLSNEKGKARLPPGEGVGFEEVREREEKPGGNAGSWWEDIITIVCGGCRDDGGTERRDGGPVCDAKVTRLAQPRHVTGFCLFGNILLVADWEVLLFAHTLTPSIWCCHHLAPLHSPCLYFATTNVRPTNSPARSRHTSTVAMSDDGPPLLGQTQ